MCEWCVRDFRYGSKSLSVSLPPDGNLTSSGIGTQNRRCQKSPLLHQGVPFILFSMASHAAHDHGSHKRMKCEIRGLLEPSFSHHLPLSHLLSHSLSLFPWLSVCPFVLAGFGGSHHPSLSSPAHLRASHHGFAAKRSSYSVLTGPA